MTATVTKLAGRHRWEKQRACQVCGLEHLPSVQLDPYDPKSWVQVWRWPDGSEVQGGTPPCPGPRPAVEAVELGEPARGGPLPLGTPVEVAAGTRDTCNRRPPVRGLLVSAYWSTGRGEHRWCDVYTDRPLSAGGYFGTVPAEQVRPADAEARRA